MIKKRKINYFHLLLLILIVITIFFIGFFSVKLLFNKTQDIQEEVDINKEVKISIEDYTVYINDDEDLDFNFIIAKLKFESEGNIDYDLSNLINSEHTLRIDNIDKYLEMFESLEYDLSEFELTKNIKLNSFSTIANVLIPFKNKQGELNVYNGKKLTFDLNHNKVNASSLKTVIKDNDSVSIIEKPYISTMMMHNGEEYDSSGIAVYTFKIIVNNVKENTYIEAAEFIKNGSTEKYEALDENYQSLKVNNIIGVPLKAGEQGALFFELCRNYGKKIDYDGVLRIKFSDMNSWIEIQTGIN